MKKHKCPVCLKHKRNINIIVPCLHMVCYDCLSIWVSQSGMKCPYCRAPFESSYSYDKDGNIKSEINSSPGIQIDISIFHPPKGSSPWEQELKKRWNTIIENTKRCFQDLNINDSTLFAYVIQSLCNDTRDIAKEKINDLFKNISPNIFDQIIKFQDFKANQSKPGFWENENPLLFDV